MIVKVLGALDIFVALVFWIFGIFHLGFLSGFVLILGFFLLVKGVAFAISLNAVSVLDIVSALIIISATSFVLPKIIVIIVALFLLQKGVFSMMS